MNILEIDPKFQELNRRTYVFHSKGFSMEEDFFDFAKKRTEDIGWDYLPIFWTHWNLAHDYARTGREELQAEVRKRTIPSHKTFTICQYDGGPQVDIRDVVLFNGAKRSLHDGIIIPMLVNPHPKLDVLPEKKYLASFVGYYRTDDIRVRMHDLLKDRKDTVLVNAKKDRDLFVKAILESYITLCPRGSAIGSFRFYESMQLGTVPVAIGDIDPRPFRKWIDWDSCSFYLKTVEELGDFLDSLDKDHLLEMGKTAAKVWEKNLYNQNWCNYVVRALP